MMKAPHRERLTRIAQALPPVGWLSLAWAAPPIVFRSVLLSEQSLHLGLADLDGYLSDLAVSMACAWLLTTGLSRLSPRTGAILAVTATLIWGTLHVGNYEHVKALGAPLQFTYAKYMGDAVFFAGSAAVVSHALIAVPLVLASCGTSLRVARRGVTPPSSRALSIVLGALLVNAAWPSDSHALSWRRDHFVEASLRPTPPGNGANHPRSHSLPRSFRANLQADLGGKAWLPPAKAKTNVLLVILEGVSGGNVDTIAHSHGIEPLAVMPELSHLAEAGVTYTTFLTDQRQTNRGEFALLCGRLPHLRSGTSRMTEYARDGGDPCLPQILAEAGYATRYMQSAPLSFMLKDQFMARAGFQEVRGNDFFKRGYARSSWGVDDRAFFEQALDAIKKTSGSAPWFTTLLTVGTHHPYTVPADYHTGDTFNDHERMRALRYLDDALGEFVHGLEAASVLDDTLLLVTSDESFGIDGLDDQTKLLSYNWGFLIARPPGAKASLVDAPFAQADVALSIADHLGISGPFVGRSVFRAYAEPRHLAFGNTYQKKVYWMSDTATVECDEALSDCQRHEHAPEGAFAPTRRSSSASERDVAPLRHLIEAETSGDVSSGHGRLPLVQNNAAVREVGPNTRGSLFGGQYFTLEADDEVAISIDATLVGRRASASLSADVYARGTIYEVLPPPLGDGDTVRFEYVYAPGEKQNGIEVRLRARAHGKRTGRLILNDAHMITRPRASSAPGTSTTRFELERASRSRVIFLGSGVPAPPEDAMSFQRNECLKQDGRGQYVAKSCPKAPVLFGPYLTAEKGARVRVRFDIRALKGPFRLQADLVSSQGDTVHAKTKPKKFAKDDSRATLWLSHRLDEPVTDMEARLSLTEAEDSAAFIVTRAVLEVVP